jgi:hypothetical protein
MFRKLLILGAIAALFTIATVVPASAIAVNRGPDGEAVEVIVPQEGNTPRAGANDAHGPMCGVEAFETAPGCANHTSPASAQENALDSPGLNAGVNLGAWNSVFQSSENSAICGIWAEGTADARPGEEALYCDYEPPTTP